MTAQAPSKTGAGTIIWFDQKAGYGFIKPDDGGSDLFVRTSAKLKTQAFEAGERIEYVFLTGEAVIRAKL
jgi:CspA family cold shock protein